MRYHVVSFYLSFFIPHLISAAADWMSTILPNMVWPYNRPTSHLRRLNYRFILFCPLITLRVSRRRREMCSGHARLTVDLFVCATYCTDPDVSWGMIGVPPSYALLGGFAIGARVSLL